MLDVATRFAIIAGDVCDPSGSLGDLAMFSALMQSFRTQNSVFSFVFIGEQCRSIVVPGAGNTPVVPAWRRQQERARSIN